MKELSSDDAWQNVEQRNPLSRWKTVLARSTAAAVLAHPPTSATLRREDNVFCIGSCFAKNIEKRLVNSGFRVLSHPQFAPDEGADFAALPNIFNVRSIVNEFRWGLLESGRAPEESFVTDHQGYVYDPHAGADTFRGPLDVVSRRRAGITANIKRLRECRIVVVTMGLVEVWYDNKLGLYLNSTLPRFLMDREDGRYSLRVLDYRDCRAALDEAWDMLRTHGAANVSLFLSVSPIPLAATFTDEDVLVANNYSKSTQVAAARDFAQAHDNVHYVPSYESVMSSARKFAWKGDLRHTTDEIVARVTDLFIHSQGLGDPLTQSEHEANDAAEWPIDPSETIDRLGTPNFFSAIPGDSKFPAGFPHVTQSSVLSPQFDASCMMSAVRRIWHAQQPPSYPEWLRFDFDTPLTLRRVFVQNQDAHPERSPTKITVEAFTGSDWRIVLSVADIAWRLGGEWQAWALPRPVSAKAFRLNILANNGDPSLVTVQNVYLSP